MKKRQFSTKVFVQDFGGSLWKSAKIYDIIVEAVCLNGEIRSAV